MIYKQISIPVGEQELREILIALLLEGGYEGFEERGEELIAFIPSDQLDTHLLESILQRYNLSYSVAEIAKTNWNKEWEQNFEPVIIKEFCTVRAHFHDIVVETPHEIVITPKMSFGTGHHATTQCMITMMKDIDFAGKSVLDLGTGTGILAILASKLGAEKVIAIDNEEWAFENAMENLERNNIANIDVRLGSIEQKGQEPFDLILANINRHILLQFMVKLYLSVKRGGTALLSGLLYEEDYDVIVQSATDAGFSIESECMQDKWLALLLVKK